MKNNNVSQRITLITQYFPPEIGGGSQRSIGFAEELRDNNFSVFVVTPFPSYLMNKEQSKTKFKLFEKYTENGLTIFRTFVYASDRGNFIKRMAYYLSFTISATLVVLFKLPKTDFTITISPPLFTGIVGVFSKYFKSSKLIFDIGDLWPESAIQLGFLTNKFAIKWAGKLEKFIYKKSDCINVVTKKTQEKIRSLYNKKCVLYIPNFVETKLVIKGTKDPALIRKLNIEGKFIVGYAGNIGSAQGIKTIIEAANLVREENNILFLIIGDGVDKELVKSKIELYNLQNVLLLPPVSRIEIVDYINLFDCVVIPLLKNPLFEITIPSKLYESMAAEIPVILGVAGEAKRILEEANAGLFFEPENAVDLAEKVEYLCSNSDLLTEYGCNARKYVMDNFDRAKVIQQFVDQLKVV